MRPRASQKSTQVDKSSAKSNCSAHQQRHPDMVQSILERKSMDICDLTNPNPTKEFRAFWSRALCTIRSYYAETTSILSVSLSASNFMKVEGPEIGVSEYKWADTN